MAAAEKTAASLRPAIKMLRLLRVAKQVVAAVMRLLLDVGLGLGLRWRLWLRLRLVHDRLRPLFGFHWTHILFLK